MTNRVVPIDKEEKGDESMIPGLAETKKPGSESEFKFVGSPISDRTSTSEGTLGVLKKNSEVYLATIHAYNSENGKLEDKIIAGIVPKDVVHGAFNVKELNTLDEEAKYISTKVRDVVITDSELPSLKDHLKDEEEGAEVKAEEKAEEEEEAERKNSNNTSATQGAEVKAEEKEAEERKNSNNTSATQGAEAKDERKGGRRRRKSNKKPKSRRGGRRVRRKSKKRRR